jgi:hypothetical protein
MEGTKKKNMKVATQLVSKSRFFLAYRLPIFIRKGIEKKNMEVATQLVSKSLEVFCPFLKPLAFSLKVAQRRLLTSHYEGHLGVWS